VAAILHQLRATARAWRRFLWYLWHTGQRSTVAGGLVAFFLLLILLAMLLTRGGREALSEGCAEGCLDAIFGGLFGG